MPYPHSEKELYGKENVLLHLGEWGMPQKIVKWDIELRLSADC